MSLARALGVLSAVFLVTFVPVTAQVQSPPPVLAITPTFETYLDALRQQAGIPGLSAVIVKDGQIAWERGFGFQNVEARIPATPATPYPVMDLSATLSATLLLQCVEERHLELDAPLSRYGLTYEDAPAATLRQVLSHTSSSPAGDTFKYDAARYSQLTQVVEWCVPQPYRKSVAHRVLERLAMIDSVPGRDLRDSTVVPEDTYDPETLERYKRVLARMAIPYKLDKRNRPIRSDVVLGDGINAADGLISTVRDLARFDSAINDGILLAPETLAASWTPGVSRDKTPLPMGLGWFVQGYRGELVVWHFGVAPGAYSSLIVKLPARHATLILLANSDGLTGPYQLETGEVTRSIFAAIFLRLFT
jgi:CubicO group peptidase (beta-lactamase class C family)